MDTERVNNHDQGRQWRKFLRMLRSAVPRRGLFAVAIILSVLEAAGGLIVPLFTRDLIDQFAASGLDIGVIIWLIAAFFVQAAAGGFSYYFMTYIGEMFVRNIRLRLWNHILKLKVSYFDKHESGELISRVTQDTNTLKTLITNHLVTSISGILSIIGALAILFVIDWKMTLIMLSAVPVSMLILAPLGRLVYKISLQMQDELAAFSAGLGRVLSDIRLVKSHNAQSVERERGERKIASLFHFGMREARIQAFVSPLMTTVIMAVLVVIIGYGGARVSAGDLSAGTLVAVIIYMFQVVVPFSMLAQFFTAFQKAMGATERIQELLCTEPEQSTGRIQQNQQNDDPDHQEPDRQSKSDFATALTLSEDWEQSEDASYQVDWNQPIHFQDVSFGYGQEDEVLRSLNFTIEPGQTVAFVGPSGAGKTTIFSLLERFYETSAGSIMLGEQNIEQIPLHAWREGIGYVLQESPLMSGSIKSNITYGLTRPVTDNEVREAARLANAAAFIEQLPSGYDTEVGERGIKLSGGQRQRIAIARALLRDPKLLLLDEATSNLDSESEALVQEALQNLMHGRTTLIIAHRLSTVVDADQIIFLENGILTGQGTHAQLMDGHALYRKFVHQQMKQESNFSVYTS